MPPPGGGGLDFLQTSSSRDACVSGAVANLARSRPSHARSLRSIAATFQFAISTALLSRITVTLTCPGYSS
jgi:hypothetical protein